jgi:GAF domain-containing protein
MRVLNQSVPHRYSAIFRFDGDTLHNICLVDKEDPKTFECSDQPITNSYCTYIRNSGEHFSVQESLLDKRVDNHPKRRVFQSYYGVPLFGPEKQLLGTVCHFDNAPLRVTDQIASDLDDLGEVISNAAFNPKSDKTG